MPSTAQAISLGLLVLFVAFLFPTIISSPSSGTSVNDVTLNGTGDTARVGDAMNILLDDKTADTAFLNVTSLVSGNSTQIAVTQGENNQFTLDGSQITITALSVEQGESGQVDLEVRHPSTFSWTDDATRLSDQLPTVFAVLAFFVVVIFIGAVMRG